MRMHAQTAMIQNGFVHPTEAAWLAEYLHEPTAFPRGRHDDQVDSTAQLVDWFKQAGAEPQRWMWQLYKHQLAQEPPDALGRKRVAPLEYVFKRSATNELHDDAGTRWMLKRTFVELDRVAVVEAGHQVDFPLKRLAKLVKIGRAHV